MFKNAEQGIREDIRNAGLHQYQVSDALGVAESTFIRWLRKPLPDDKKVEVYSVIERLTREQKGEN